MEWTHSNQRFERLPENETVRDLKETCCTVFVDAKLEMVALMGSLTGGNFRLWPSSKRQKGRWHLTLLQFAPVVGPLWRGKFMKVVDLLCFAANMMVFALLSMISNPKNLRESVFNTDLQVIDKALQVSKKMVDVLGILTPFFWEVFSIANCIASLQSITVWIFSFGQEAVVAWGTGAVGTLWAEQSTAPSW